MNGLNEILRAALFNSVEAVVRVVILSRYFLVLLAKEEGSLPHVNMVSKILDHCFQQNDFAPPLKKLANDHFISVRTLQRYFEICTGISSKKALQVMRIRKAVAHIANSPHNFNYSVYSYYDQSHFYKHLKQFLQKNTLKNVKPHIKLLESLHNNKTVETTPQI